MILCPRCNQRNAELHPAYGIVNCLNCQAEQNQTYELPLVNPPEFAGESVRWQRKAFSRDIIQKHRYGQLSKEWVDAYPDKAKAHHTPQELKQAKNVWKGDL